MVVEGDDDDDTTAVVVVVAVVVAAAAISAFMLLLLPLNSTDGSVGSCVAIIVISLTMKERWNTNYWWWCVCVKETTNRANEK